MCFLEENYKKDGKKKTNYEKCENALYMKSLSMPLNSTTILVYGCFLGEKLKLV